MYLPVDGFYSHTAYWPSLLAIVTLYLLQLVPLQQPHCVQQPSLIVPAMWPWPCGNDSNGLVCVWQLACMAGVASHSMCGQLKAAVAGDVMAYNSQYNGQRNICLQLMSTMKNNTATICVIMTFVIICNNVSSNICIYNMCMCTATIYVMSMYNNNESYVICNNM